MLSVRHLSFQYDRRSKTLHDVSFEMGPGFTLLVGENGSGKTTLIKNLVGALLPQAGTVELEGKEYMSDPYIQDIAYVPQEFSVYPNLKVRDILSFVASQRGVPKKSVEARVSEAAEKTNITPYVGHKFKHCSAGTQKRIGIATALLGEPKLIILDEPTAGVDPKERIAFYKTMRQCFPDKIVLLSTHIMDDMAHLADHVVMLHEGCVTYQGTYEQFCHALDGILYEVTVPMHITPAWLDQYEIISGSEENGQSKYRLVSHIKPDIPNCECVEATTEDLWNHFSNP